MAVGNTAKPRQWTRSVNVSDGEDARETQFLASTDHSLISIPALMEAFKQDYFYWANPLPAPAMQKMIDGSLCVGVYKCLSPSSTESTTTPTITTTTTANQQCEGQTNGRQNLELIGFARLITDDVTFAYLTDVYIQPEYQGTGLGTWMMECLDELVGGMEHLRRYVLFTKGKKTRDYYEKVVDMKVMGYLGNEMYLMGRRGPGGYTP